MATVAPVRSRFDLSIGNGAEFREKSHGKCAETANAPSLFVSIYFLVAVVDVGMCNEKETARVTVALIRKRTGALAAVHFIKVHA